MRLSLSNGHFQQAKHKRKFAAVKQLGFENIEFNMKSIKKEHDTRCLPGTKSVGGFRA